MIIVLFGCFTYKYSPKFAPESTIQKVTDHRVAIATYYEMYEQEYLRRMNRVKQVKDYRNIPIFIKQDRETKDVTVAYLGAGITMGDNHLPIVNPTYYTMPKGEYLRRIDEIKHIKDYRNIENVPIFIKKDKKTGLVTVAYLGAGKIIKDNNILTVNHLFDEEAYYNYMYIWIFKEGVDHPIKAELVARTECELITREVHFNDYAIIKMEEDLELPGLKIAKPDTLKMGDKVIFTGSTGGFAFFTRFGYVTKLEEYFQRDIEGKLELVSLESFPFWTVYPGGSGDSGGSVVNIKGEIVTIMYCGITNHSEEYIFGNPTQMIWDFLKEYNLEHLAR